VSTPAVGQLLRSAAGGVSGASNSDSPQGAAIYSGQVDGGNATLHVTPTGNNQYQIDLSAIASGNRGGGAVSGTIEPDGKSDGGYILTVIANGGASPLPCALDVKFVGPNAQIMEDFNRDKEGCSGYHGAALSFDGTLPRQD
jgi:hypothetical protein